MTEPRTLPEAFQRAVAAQPDELALRTVSGDASYTWAEYGEEVRRIAGGLAALGVKRGDTVAAMLTNRPEFNLCEVAAAHLGATTYSVYNTSSPEQVTYLLTHADTRVVITEQQFVETVKEAGGPVEHLLVVEDGDIDRLQPADGFDFEAAWQAVVADDVLCLIYTSGTTGPPKGVEHTHAGTLNLARSFNTPFPMNSDDIAISYLPSAHAADRFITHYFAIAAGTQVTTVPDIKQLPAALAQVRPTIFAAVPRVWEKIKLAVELQLAETPDVAAAFQAGVPQVVDAVRAKLGFDRLQWALSGAAAIPEDVYAFMEKLGVPVSEVWGMSECGLPTGAKPSEARRGTVGKVLPTFEIKHADDGELLVRGPSVMRGYRNDPEKTAEAIDAEGWLSTGDIATIDDDGYIKIVDRKKELIINAAGKNMSPSNIENAISSSSPLIGSVMAVGDGRPYNVALITLDPEAAVVFGARLGLDPEPDVLVKDPRVQQIVQDGVDAGNAKLSRVEQIKKFTLLPTYWVPGGDEVTPTMKLMRRPTAAKYAAAIEELYQDDDR